ncbi:MAG TPA: FmdB family zinc ribbon protein [Candidatus Tripitaka californicus]|uniref:FmdB family zinc ribbon protein n=1 Tax=Candidatus Tripitaka californicus TaxID=3367616 RepID=UPI0040283229|nr:zinc ribbon domain-containing protein [Planctomycetota bacterium]
MPIYEFQCNSCTSRFEEYFASSSQSRALKCPQCGSGQVNKVFSVFGMGGSNDNGGSGSGSGSSCGSCSATSCDTCG